jgi:hypothetical protein
MPTFNTTDPKPGYVYDSATDTWFPLVGIAPGSSVVRWRKTAAGGETSFTGLDDLGATLSYNAGTEQVYLNGVLLVRTEDYTATNGTSVTALNALAASDVIEVISFNATNVQVTDALLRTDINAKGDLIVGAAVDTAAILASGTNGQVLKVNTATTSGLEWGSIDADIEGVTAGTGLTGGGTSGTVTLALDSAAVIAPTIVNAKGDLISASADNTPAILSVGTNGQVLTAASGQATGLQWATPVTGGMTLISETTLSGATTTLSSIPQTYNLLYLIVKNVQNSGSATTLKYTVNGNSGTVYSVVGATSASNQTWSQTSVNLINAAFPNTANVNFSGMTFYDYTNTTTWKKWDTWTLTPNSGTPANLNFDFYYVLTNQTAAISSITFFPGTGTHTGGTILLYGVK